MIATNPEPCWVLVRPDGTTCEGEAGVFHYRSRDEASEHADAFDDPELGGYPEPRQEDAACVIAACDGCGYFHDEENLATHWESAETVRQDIKDSEVGETTDAGDFTCVTCLDEKADTAKVEAAS